MKFLDALFSVPGQRMGSNLARMLYRRGWRGQSQVAEAAERAGVTAPVIAWIKVFGRAEAASKAWQPVVKVGVCNLK